MLRILSFARCNFHPFRCAVGSTFLFASKNSTFGPSFLAGHIAKRPLLSSRSHQFAPLSMRSSLLLVVVGLLALVSLASGCPAPAQNPNGKYKAADGVKVYTQDQATIQATVGEVSTRTTGRHKCGWNRRGEHKRTAFRPRAFKSRSPHPRRAAANEETRGRGEQKGHRLVSALGWSRRCRRRASRRDFTPWVLPASLLLPPFALLAILPSPPSSPFLSVSGVRPSSPFQPDDRLHVDAPRRLGARGPGAARLPIQARTRAQHQRRSHGRNGRR